MKVDHHVWFHDDPTARLILNKVDKLMATQAELAASLDLVSVQINKIASESSATLAKVADLEAALAAAGNTSPAVDAALAALKAQVQIVDDLVPDAP